MNKLAEGDFSNFGSGDMAYNVEVVYFVQNVHRKSNEPDTPV